jgi:NitT/TauT family transport system ATP-binding protein
LLRGEFVCLVGASGCGKTTLLNIIAGLEKPDSGTVQADGKPITGPGRERLVMFQEPALFPWLNVFGNVLFGLKLKPNLTNKDRQDVAKYYLELVGLSRFERANIHELSGGMKQRVSLARALAPNPRVLLMDEPFAALDALTREQLYGDLQRIWKARNKTIVFVTHNVREAACLGDRVIVFSPRPGRIREEFAVDLPRPRDINSVDLAVHATEITKALKRLQPTGDRYRRMKRFLLAALFFAVLLMIWEALFRAKDLVASPPALAATSGRLFKRRCRGWNSGKSNHRYDASIAHRLHHWTSCRAAVGIADCALEGVPGYHRNASTRSPEHCRVSAGCRLLCCGSDKPKPPCFSSW